MKTPEKTYRFLLLAAVFFFFVANSYAQTKPIKRPKSKLGLTNVDQFVDKSFDVYDKVYKYDGYAASGTPLDDNDIDVLEEALNDLEDLSASASGILGDVDNASVFKQAKATLQINKAKNALSYSIKTTKKLLAGQNKASTDTNETNEIAENNSSENQNSEDSMEEVPIETSNISDNLEVYSKFDFVPGDEILFFDDFSQDFIGDFPSKWNTNATGEVVKIGNKGNWFQLKPGYRIYYIPDFSGFPEDYTIEFDVLTQGISKKTSSTARLHIILSDNDSFNDGTAHYTTTSFPFGQYGVFDIDFRNVFNKTSGGINSAVKADIRNAVLNQPHISIAVTKNRYRVWVNEIKYVDVPRFIKELNVLNYIKFHINAFKDGEESVFIKNLKIAAGGQDLRRTLMNEGRVSTNGILFDSGSAVIKPQSYGIIRQISQVLMQDETIKLNIIGHTDNDGSERDNLKLSKSRAEAVKTALTNIYKIEKSRLETEGQGETKPEADNSTKDGKAQNRRVEFVKI